MEHNVFVFQVHNGTCVETVYQGERFVLIRRHGRAVVIVRHLLGLFDDADGGVVGQGDQRQLHQLDAFTARGEREPDRVHDQD